MKAKIIILTLCLVIPSVGMAGKMYKIVDENGKVTFSQTPPRNFDEDEPEVKAKIEEMNVDSGAATRISEEFGEKYCGEIRLPSQSNSYGSSSKYFSRNVSNSLESWRESVASIGRNIDRRNQIKIKNNQTYRNSDSKHNNQRSALYEEGMSRDTKRLRDLRCAINWAEGLEGKIAEYELEDREEKSRLIEVADKLEHDIEVRCGKQPEFDPSISSNERLRKNWYNCSKDKMRDLKKVRRRIDRLE